jgi:hypothetical protein
LLLAEETMKQLPLLWMCLIVSAGPATRQSDAPPIEKAGWTLTFHDEFDGNELDTHKWSDHYWHGRTHANRELEYYAPDGYEVKDGLLRLIARPVAREIAAKQKASHTRPE